MRKEREGGRGRKWGEAGREGRRFRTVFVERVRDQFLAVPVV